ncbi:MAG: hypothetical protein ACU837_15865 [Gammaproteobacteria bacterium]
MNNNNSDIESRAWRNPLSYGCIVLVCWVGVATVSLAAKHHYQAELNRLLEAAVAKEPALFGSNALCERDVDFWQAVNKSSLLAVLEREEGFREIALDRNHTVWFVPISTCFSGNRTGFMLFVRIGRKFHGIDEPITGSIENVRLEGDKIVFNVTTYAGLFEEYHYLYAFDGRQLSQVLLDRIQRR